MARMSAAGETSSAPVGKSGPRTCASSSSSVADGFSSRWMQAAATSRRLWGGISVDMPTAMPDAPFRRRFGRRAGRRTGSLSVPSKFGCQSVVPCPSSLSKVAA